MTFSPGSGRIDDWTDTRPERDPAADAETRRLWLEYCRRQLGRQSMPDDEYERLGHRVYGYGADPEDDPEF